MHDILSVIIDFHNFQIDLWLSTNESAADMLRADTLREEELYITVHHVFYSHGFCGHHGFYGHFFGSENANNTPNHAFYG